MHVSGEVKPGSLRSTDTLLFRGLSRECQAVAGVSRSPSRLPPVSGRTPTPTGTVLAASH